MNGNYMYIIEKLGEPVYYDVYGAPHYKLLHYTLFSHGMKEFVENLRVCVCQACGVHFTVQCTHPVYSSSSDNCCLHYGDPPVHECIGDTMNVDETRPLTKNEFHDMLKRALKYEETIEGKKAILKMLKKKSEERPLSRPKKLF